MNEHPGRPPNWWTEGYNDNPIGLKIAIAHWRMPHSTAAEREAVRAFTPAGETFPCSSCGKFAFSSPRTCFWCTHGSVATSASPDLLTPRQLLTTREQSDNREQDATIAPPAFNLEMQCPRA